MSLMKVRRLIQKDYSADSLGVYGFSIFLFETDEGQKWILYKKILYDDFKKQNHIHFKYDYDNDVTISDSKEDARQIWETLVNSGYTIKDGNQRISDG